MHVGKKGCKCTRSFKNEYKVPDMAKQENEGVSVWPGKSTRLHIGKGKERTEELSGRYCREKHESSKRHKAEICGQESVWWIHHLSYSDQCACEQHRWMKQNIKQSILTMSLPINHLFFGVYQFTPVHNTTISIDLDSPSII